MKQLRKAGQKDRQKALKRFNRQQLAQADLNSADPRDIRAAQYIAKMNQGAAVCPKPNTAEVYFGGQIYTLTEMVGDELAEWARLTVEAAKIRGEIEEIVFEMRRGYEVDQEEIQDLYKTLIVIGVVLASMALKIDEHVAALKEVPSAYHRELERKRVIEDQSALNDDECLNRIVGIDRMVAEMMAKRYIARHPEDPDGAKKIEAWNRSEAGINRMAEIQKAVREAADKEAAQREESLVAQGRPGASPESILDGSAFMARSENTVNHDLTKNKVKTDPVKTEPPKPTEKPRSGFTFRLEG